MAEANEAVEDTADDESSGSGNKKLIIIFAVAALLLVGGSVGGTLYFLGFLGGGEDAAAAEDLEETQPPAIYFALNPKFKTNYEVKGRQRLFQVAISLVTRDEAVIEALSKHVPAIKSKLVILLSGQDFIALQTQDGREALRAECLAAVQSIMNEEIGEPGVEKVLFTDFVMQ